MFFLAFLKYYSENNVSILLFGSAVRGLTVLILGILHSIISAITNSLANHFRTCIKANSFLKNDIYQKNITLNYICHFLTFRHSQALSYRYRIRSYFIIHSNLVFSKARKSPVFKDPCFRIVYIIPCVICMLISF